MIRLILAGGGEDYACEGCLDTARDDRGAQLLTTVNDDACTEACVYCGREG